MPPESLTCKECKTEYPLDASYVCERCFGPLEVAYASRAGTRRRRAAPAHTGRSAFDLALPRLPAADGAAAARRAPRRLDAAAARRPPRQAPRPARGVGQERRREPDALVQGPRRRRRARPREVSSASRSIACASTGNLANAVAAHAAAAGLESYVFIPVGPRGAEDPRDRRLRDDDRRDQRQLRRRQPRSAPRSPASAMGVRRTSTSAPTTPRARRRSRTRSPSSSAGRSPDRIVGPIASGSHFTKIARGFEEWIELGPRRGSPCRR